MLRAYLKVLNHFQAKKIIRIFIRIKLRIIALELAAKINFEPLYLGHDKIVDCFFIVHILSLYR